MPSATLMDTLHQAAVVADVGSLQDAQHLRKDATPQDLASVLIKLSGLSRKLLDCTCYYYGDCYCTQKKKGVNGGAVAGGLIGALVFLAIIGFLLYWFWWRKRQAKRNAITTAPSSSLPEPSKVDAPMGYPGITPDPKLPGQSPFQAHSGIVLPKPADAVAILSDKPQQPEVQVQMGYVAPAAAPTPATIAQYHPHNVIKPIPVVNKLPASAVQQNNMPAGPLAAKWKAGALQPVSVISDPNTSSSKINVATSSELRASGTLSTTEDKPSTVSLQVAGMDSSKMSVSGSLASTAVPPKPVVMSTANTQRSASSAAPPDTGNATRVSGALTPAAGSAAVTAASRAQTASSSLGDMTIMSAVQMHLMESLRIQWDSIKLGEVLGEGGFGKVYKGMWRKNRVAVKMLNLDGAGSEAKAILHQEALIMSQLRHPNIAMVYGVVDEGPHQAIVMQFYKQGTLAHAMRTNWFLNLDEAARLGLAYQIADGMRFLHERTPQPVIHGDLKTSNLLLGENYQRVFIADFGLACKLNSPSMAMQMGALTASISPPEVLSDPMAPRAASADVYAFSIVLSEMMQGYPAFRGMTVSQIKQAVCAGNRPTLAANVSPRVRDLIQACWAQDPAARPTFADIATRIEDAITEIKGYPEGTTLMTGMHTRMGNNSMAYY